MIDTDIQRLAREIARDLYAWLPYIDDDSGEITAARLAKRIESKIREFVRQKEKG